MEPGEEKAVMLVYSGFSCSVNPSYILVATEHDVADGIHLP